MVSRVDARFSNGTDLGDHCTARDRTSLCLGSAVNASALLWDHCETHVELRTAPDAVFAYLDDHRRMAAHMTERSWKMAGSRMMISLDAKEGRAVGSQISLSGRILGVLLQVDETVTVYAPPVSKTWQTVGSPHLLVIGAYEMGFSLRPLPHGSELTVFINYALPDGGASRVLGQLFGRAYARWCTKRMARDAMTHFNGRFGSA